jgi:hypothetical protein
MASFTGTVTLCSNATKNPRRRILGGEEEEEEEERKKKGRSLSIQGIFRDNFLLLFRSDFSIYFCNKCV